MKKVLLAAFVAVFALVSCNKEDDGGIPTTKTVEVSIKSGADIRAAGTAIDGVGQENQINNWIAYAKNSTDANYTAATATGAGSKVTFTSVPVGSTVYVVANYTASLPTGTAVTLAQIEAAVESISKATLDLKTIALRTAVSNPLVGSMLMTGSASVLNAPMDATDTDKVKLTVGLDREYAKVNFTVMGSGGAAIPGVSINSIDDISVHRVVNRVSMFKKQNAEWYIVKTPAYVPDISANGGPSTTGASDYVFHFPTSGSGSKTSNFYVLPNYAGLDAYATAVVVKANISGIIGGVTYTNADRYFRAFVYDTDIAAERGITLKNTIYNITATINGAGEGDIPTVLENDNIDLNVYVEVKKWNVRTTTVNMD